MRLAKRVMSIQPSPTLAISAKAKALKAAGEKVFPMAAGEPDFPTPEIIRKSCIAAMEAGHTGYAPAAGIPELRRVILERYRQQFDLGAGEDQVVVTVGAKQCLYNAMQALLQPGDRVVMQAPYWVSYPAQVTLAGAESSILPMVASESGFNRQALLEQVDKRTRMIVLNSPSNPSGQVLSEADLDAVAEVARSHDLVILSDDIYDRLTFDGARAVHLLERHPDLADRTLVINGVSKTYAMTGWRLGYGVGPADLIAAMRKIQDQSTSNAVTFVQHAAITALNSPAEVTESMRQAFSRRRDLLVELLNDLPSVECPKPAGSFYTFPSVKGLLGRKLDGRELDSALTLADWLLEYERVAVVPGEAFGAPGFLRFSFACSRETIEQAIKRVANLIDRLH